MNTNSLKIKHREIIHDHSINLEKINLTDSKLLEQIYLSRGIKKISELDRSTKNLLPPKGLKGIDKGCTLLLEALNSSKKIVVVGDYDTDGATSTALSILALRQLGFINIDYFIPNRFDHGYGLTVEVVDLVIKMGGELLITVDNGISSIEAVRYAKEKGIKVLITDHHLQAQTLPDADAIVNPNQNSCSFESKNLAGVGVVFYLMLALRSSMQSKGYFDKVKAPNLASLLDLVALGTVADLVPLDLNNRTLVYQGIARIRAGYSRPGINALLQVSKKDPSKLVASDLGFSLAPKLNAAGRLDEMSLGVQLLICDDPEQANIIANELDTLNKSRREIEQGMQEEALKALNKLKKTNDLIPNAICLFEDDWHQGLIGLVASRIKEAYYRPTFAFAKSSDGQIKGSARSIAGIHIRDMLELVDKEIPNVILGFGGHAMAAGLSLNLSDLDLFSQTLNNVIEENISSHLFENIILTDGALEKRFFNIEQAAQLRDAGPWGQEFPEPIFDGTFKLIQQRVVGLKHLKMLLEFEGLLIDAIAFNIDTNIWPDPNIKQVKCVYSLEINEFRGNRNIQLLIKNLIAIL